MEVIRIYLKRCNLSKDVAEDILEWPNRIHVADPNVVGTSFAERRKKKKKKRERN